MRGTSEHFHIRLAKPSPLARPVRERAPVTRVGADIRRTAARDRLVIGQLAKDPLRSTPVGEWNEWERRQEDRGQGERHCCLALQPGDRIKGVNDFGSQTAMLSEMQNAMSETTPRELSLAISRNIADVLQPSQTPTASRPNSRPALADADRPAAIAQRPATAPPEPLPEEVPTRPATPEEAEAEPQVSRPPSRSDGEVALPPSRAASHTGVADSSSAAGAPRFRSSSHSAAFRGTVQASPFRHAGALPPRRLNRPNWGGPPSAPSKTLAGRPPAPSAPAVTGSQSSLTQVGRFTLG